MYVLQCAFYQGAYFSPDRIKNILGNLFNKNAISMEPESGKLLQTVNQWSPLTSSAAQSLSQLCNRMKASAGIKPTDLGPAQMLRPLWLGS